jgi:hypothetical protein
LVICNAPRRRLIFVLFFHRDIVKKNEGLSLKKVFLKYGGFLERFS